ncbi:hypothetical protein JTE90_023724 [Oedothorax gibbosus]|uniref:Gustatory receptor n=1 Tax=Oedothorax gibbosus TaxID=931172 RepID=A0AAV6VBP8_9ARAC|nr:hypothetical protein JTE90_023724 [Oedothorax gibbosus]
MMNLHMNYSLYFVVALMYCFLSFVSFNGLKGKDLVSRTPVKIRYSDSLHFQNELEKQMSFPIFLVISKITTEVFTTVSLMSSKTRSDSLDNFFVSSLQMMIWFVFIVVLADLVNARCLETIEDALNLDNSRRIQFDYYKYKKMKKCCTLTAWGLTVIDRKLLLTSLALLITYSVAIFDIKEKQSA